MTDAGGASEARDYTAQRTWQILRYVASVQGEDAIGPLLALAGETRSPEELQDITKWSSYAQVAALFEAAAELLDDRRVGRRIGEFGLARPEGDEAPPREAGRMPRNPVGSLLASLGSPRELLQRLPVINSKFTTASTAEVLELEDERAVVAFTMRDGCPPNPLMCDYVSGLLSGVSEIFGLGMAEVEQTECTSRGDSRCTYHVAWRAVPVEGAEAKVRALEIQLAALAGRFETLQAAATDLVSAEDVASVLARIAERAGQAVRAPRYLLVVQPEDGAELSIHHDGFTDSEARACARQLLDEQPDPEDGSRIVVDVASARRSYGRLAVMYQGGKAGFLPEERRLLRAYARHAAAALDAATALDQVRQLALHDALTGLPNRRLFEDRVNQALALAGRHGLPVGVMFLDLDRFKTVNDSLGHDAGDDLLCQVAERLSGLLRKSDTVARMGGDEFTVLLSEMTAPEDADLVAEKILNAFLEPFFLSAQRVFVSPSIGIAVSPRDGDRFEVLMKNADTAMYAAKANGRNNFQVYAPAMNEAAYAALTLEADLHTAAERGELFLVYQPQMDVARGSVIGVEALVRWQHPTLGLLEPWRFLPLAEETGVIRAIDEWVLHEACRQAVEWSTSLAAPMRIAVNVSGRHFSDDSFVRMVGEIVCQSGLDPALLEIEITEGVAARGLGDTLAVLEELRGAGVTVAIDDFGTGYSMLSRLQDFPVDRIKIDKSFVDRISATGGAPIVAALVAMAEGLGLEIMAEGVETELQRDFLLAQGCYQMQGYLFAHPLPKEEIEALLLAAPKAAIAS